MHRILPLLVIFAALAHAADDPHVTAAWDHFYNLEFDQAIAEFGEASRAHPQDAEIHNNVAQALLYREMYRDGALESELVTGNSAFLRRPKLNASVEVQKRFDDEITTAIAISQKQLQMNPNDTGALYTLGVSYGLRSNYNFLVRKAWRDALSDATQAKKMHNRITELEPNNYDARLVQGVYEYLVGSLNWMWRSLGFLAGFKGDREGGLRTVELVAKKGVKNKGDAEIVLCALYRRENRAKAAIPLLDDLLRRYPRNYLFMFEKAQMYSILGDKKDALATLDRIAQLKERASPGFARVPWDKVYFEEGNIQFWYNDLDQALLNLQKVTASPGELDLNTGVLAFMRVGQIYDLQNRHDLAKKAYEQAINFAPQADAAKESEHYIREPYRRNPS